MEGTEVLKDIIAAGGSGLLIPAVLFVLALYAARGIFGLHGRKIQQRKEFLEIWNLARAHDELWLEVAIRQLFGTYLPAHVIRLALSQPARSKALLELSQLWPFLHYDQTNRTVRWKQPHSTGSIARMFNRHLPIAKSALLALGAATCGLVAYNSAEHLLQWIYSTLAMMFTFCAFLILTYEDAVHIADETGDDWIIRINSSLVQ